MQITVQQHNAVVVGLSTQLSLQKQITHEKNAIIAKLVEENNRLRGGIEGLEYALKDSRDTANTFAQKLYACEVVLDSPGASVDGSLQSAALRRIQELQEKLATCCSGKCKRGRCKK